jgi:hypothetical protein
MAELLIRHGEWVVVCDGAKALILENAGDTKFPNLKTIKCWNRGICPRTRSAPTRRDAPGFRRQCAKCGRAIRLARPVRRTFLVHLAQQLDSAVTAGKAKVSYCGSATACARHDPPGLFPDVEGAVRAEVDKDFVKMPVHEIERHLTAV